MRNFSVLNLFSLCVVLQAATAQTPTINNFSPQSGVAGTSVIITGSNFSSTPANNTVKFNGVSATVSAATTCMLFVTVPSGASSGLVSVTVAGQTGTSLNKFVPGSSNFYGVVSYGGAGLGTIVKANSDGTNLSAVYSFNGSPDGGSPQSNGLVLASNGRLYGTAYNGGSVGNYGELFEFDPATSVYTKKIDFDFTNTGGYPVGSLIQASNGKLYGLTNVGGANNVGVVFEYDIASSVLTKKADFSVASGYTPNGGLAQAPNGKLYGMTYAGGASNVGTVFEFDTSTSALTKKADFDRTNYGANPYGGFALASNGKLYGFLWLGITGNSNGSLIEYDPSTSTLTKKLDLTASTGGALGDLVQTSNGKMYANTWAGILEYDIAAVTLSRKITYNNAASFGSTPYYNAMTQGSNGKLYGMNYGGGSNAVGVLFEYDPSSVAFQKRFDFDVTNGKNPYSVNLIEVPAYSTLPTIASFSPTSTSHGTGVTITGTNFIGTTAVSFGGTAAQSFVVNSASSITAVVAEGSTGVVSVTNASGTVTSSGFTFVPAPTITSFSPSSGAAGTSVVINGANFSTTPANNIVYFGATKATVTAATTTQLTVTAPTGSSYQPISVLVNGVLAYASKPFLMTFAGGAGITTASYASKVDLTTGLNPFSLQSVDVDGDGKADLVVSNANTSAISVFRNTSSGPTNISFAPKVDIATSALPSGISLNDVDGDGKSDLVVAFPTPANIGIFRNTSTSGSITFASEIDLNFTLGALVPQYLAIDDLDKDGRNDIIAAWGSSAYVFRNQGTGPGAISFAPYVLIPFASGPGFVTTADIDNDGLVDIVGVSSQLTVLRNTSTGPGTISFGTAVNFLTGNNPLSVAAGDFDGDNKVDLVVTNSQDVNLSVFRNISSGTGSIAFAPKTDFATGTLPYAVAPADLDGDGKIDIAATDATANTISVLVNTSAGTGSVSFAAKADLTTAAYPRSIAIADFDNDGKPDLASANNTATSVSVLRYILPPSISSFAPTSAPGGATITITGTNFTNATAVSFGGTPATSFNVVSPTSITAVVAASGSSGNVTVTAPGGTATASGFTFFPLPTIGSFLPTNATQGATVTLTGTNFSGATAVSFGGTAATSFNVVSPTSITAVVGVGSTGNISVTTAGGTATKPGFGYLPQAPTALAASSITQNSFLATWNTVPLATGYYIDVAADNLFNIPTYTNLGPTTGTTYTIPSLNASTTYYYRVRAANGNGSSTNSNVISVTTSSSGGGGGGGSVQASSIVFGTPTTSAVSLSFTVGDGGARLVVGNTGSALAAGPSNGTSYTANTVFGSGDAVGTGFVVGSGVSNAVSITNLTPGSTYYFQVFEYNGSGASTSYNPNTATGNPASITMVCAAPVATAATAVGQTSFTANWNASNGATGYFVDVATASDFSTMVSGYSNVSVGNVTSYLVNTGLTAGNTYYYRVRASNVAGPSAASNSITVVTVPATPVAAAATSITQTAFTANWGTVNSATKYFLDVSASNTFTSFVGIYNNLDVGNVSTYVVNASLAAGTTYYFRVRANGTSGVSGSSNVIAALTIPPDPLTTAATAIAQTSFTANWNASGSATSYTIDVSTSNTFTTFVTGYSSLSVGNVTSYLVGTNITAGNNYYYRVKATNASGTSGFSNTTLLVTVPVNPTATAATSVLQTSFNANWNSSPTATKYFLDVSTSNTFTSFVTGYNNLDVGNVTTLAVNTGLAGGTTYYYRVRASSASGLSGSSNTITVQTISPDPVATAATALAQSSFSANWNASTAATNYLLDVSTSNAFTSFVTGFNGLSIGNVTTYSVNTNLVAGTTYYYRVRAQSPAGISGNSNTIVLATIPPDPIAVAATTIQQTAFTANWNASTSATGYVLDVGDATFSSFLSGYNGLSVGNVTSYTVNTGVNPGTTYYYRVRAVSSAGTSGNSNSISTTTIPPNPTAIAAQSIAQTSFVATWNASTGATGYFLDLSTASNFATFVTGYSNLSVGNATTQLVNLNITAGTVYYYRVRAANAAGPSGNSNTITLVTTPPNVVATAASAITETSFSANWNSSVTATNYFLDVSTANTFSSFIINNLSVGTTSSVVNTGITGGTTYYYRVRASSASGTSNNSNTVSVVTAPPAPVANPATSLGQTSFTANWSSAPTATGYEIDVSTSNTFSSFVTGYSALAAGNVSSLLINLNVTPGTNYYYRVRATSASGVSGNSNSVTVLTIPPNPIATAASSIGETSFSANWNSSVSGVGYFIDISSSNTFASFVANNISVGNVVTYLANTGISGATTYYYRVRASNASGTSGNSNVISFVTAPTAPVATAASAISQTGFNANWNVSPTATGYLLDVSTSNTFSPLLSSYSNVAVGNVTTYLVSGLSSGTTYYFRVRGSSASGISGNSNTISITTIPPDPVTATSTGLSETAFTANWNPSSSATGYFLDVSTSNTFASFVAGYNNKSVGNVTSIPVNSGINGGVTYYYRVRASNTSGVSGNSSIGSALTLPPAPTSLAATSISASGFTASWTVTPGATGYFLDVATDNGFISSNTLSVGNLTSFPISGLGAGSTYYYRVRAADGSGNSANSNVISVTTSAAGSGGGVQAANLSFSSVTNSSVNVTFTLGNGTARILVVTPGAALAALPSNSTTYNGNSSYGSGTPLGTGFVVANGASNSVVVSNLAAATTYYFQVFEYSGAPGTESYNTAQGLNNPSTKTTIAIAPTTQATALQFSSITTNSVVVSFTRGDGASNLLLAKAGSSIATDPSAGSGYTGNNTFGNGSPVGSGFAVGSGSGPITISNLSPGTAYYFKVYEYNGSGSTTNYNLNNAIGNPASIITVPSPPVSAAATQITTNSFVANWAAATGATGYFVDVSTDNFSTFVPSYNNNAAGNSTTVSINGLLPGTTYQYRIRAANSSGNSVSSNVVSAITIPATPVAQTATSISQNGFNANWAAVTGATGYTLDVATSADFVNILANYNNLPVPGATTATASITGLTAGTNYFYRIRASNASGTSSSSNSIQLTTSSPAVAPTSRTIPTLTSGGALEDYSMFSIPLVLDKNDSLISTIFSSLGAPAKDKWRLLHWNGDHDTEYGVVGGPTTIDRGKSYWFNSVSPPAFTVSGIEFSKPSFSMTLLPGWNQIGSPYNFDISWSDVISVNGASGKVESTLYKYNPSIQNFASTDNLKAWGGAFVFNGTGGNISLTIPKTVKQATGGRLAANQMGNELSGDNWLISLKLSSAGVENDLVAFGMHPDAHREFDRYDAVTLPRVFKYLEMSSSHPTFFATRFNKDVVPSASSYNWTYHLSSNLQEKTSVLSWDRNAFGDNDAQIFLYDPAVGILINMKQTNQYVIDMSISNTLSFFYGADEKSLRPNVSGMVVPYPNPAFSQMTIPFFTGQNDSDVSIELFDMTGRMVKTLISGSFSAGVHTAEWDLNDLAGNRVPAGMYLCRLYNNTSAVQIVKVIVH